MDEFQNMQYDHKAVDLLHIGLTGCVWKADKRTGAIEKSMLASVFHDAFHILKSNEEQSEEFLSAQAVAESCRNVVRCMCLDKEASKIVIRDEVYHLDALEQYKNALRNYDHMKDAGVR